MATPGSSRRDWLKITGLSSLAAGLGVGGVAMAPALGRSVEQPGPAAGSGPRRRSLRLAHLTDIHVKPEDRAYEGMVRCLRHAQELRDRPELIVTGGDLIMDAFAQTRDRTKAQWDLFTRALRDECSLPVEHTIGNHDIWGWNKTKSGVSPSEPGYGKRWALELLGLPRAYRSIDRGGWRVVILDSVQPREEGYLGRLDDEQFEWLEETLARTPAGTHVLVVTHIPILCAGQMLTDSRVSDEGMLIPAASQMTDNHRTVELFSRHPRVRACLSGHIHVVDRIDFQGVTYLCSGAVSGAWWRGSLEDAERRRKRAAPGEPARPMRCEEGYNVVDLYDDGTIEHRYVDYGWAI